MDVAEALKRYLDSLKEPQEIARNLGWYEEADRRLVYVRKHCGTWERPGEAR